MDLSLDDINISLKAIGSCTAGRKLMIIDDKFLTEDNRYASSICRMRDGQNRMAIVDFLDSLYSQLVQKMDLLYEDIKSIRDNKKINISILSTTILNLDVFLHNFDKIRSTYTSDAHTHARFGMIRNKFFHYRESFISKMLLDE